MDNLKPPDKTLVDHAISVTQGAAGIAPGGSLAVAFSEMFFVSPLQRRKAVWMNAVASGIRRLEDQGRILEAKLREHDAFLDLLYGATAAASRTSDKKRLQALSNFVFHAALNNDIDDAIESVILDRVSNLTSAHFRILELFANHDDCEFGWKKHIPDYDSDSSKWDAVKDDVHENMRLIHHTGLTDLGTLVLTRIAEVDA